MIHVHDLQVSKGGKTICQIDDLTVQRGERVAIVGPNGCGKTTLLRVLAGLEPKYSGECRIEIGLPDRVFVHQSPYLFRGSVLTNASYGPAARGLDRRARRKLAIEWLERFGISQLAETDIAKLSGGEARRAALARAMILRPQLLLLDEPLGDLDDAGADLLAKALDDTSDSTVVIASPIELPAGIATRTIRLSGRELAPVD
jgi:ABC-type nitrate/sulfonate/bicarbonate transport system ATPase subunit